MLLAKLETDVIVAFEFSSGDRCRVELSAGVDATVPEARRAEFRAQYVDDREGVDLVECGVWHEKAASSRTNLEQSGARVAVADGFMKLAKANHNR